MLIRFDPDEWKPTQSNTRSRRSTGGLEPDQLVVWDRQPYRVIEVRERDHADWTENYRAAWVKHGMPEPSSWYYRPRVVVIRHDDQPNAKPLHLQAPNNANWYTLPEHYWVCRQCNEIPPCRHVHNEGIMDRASERMSKDMALVPGVCHGCREPITARQRSFTFPGPNLIRPDLGNGSAVFHTRRGCMDSVKAYDRRWAGAEPDRQRFFYCKGSMTEHHDKSTECTNPACLGTGPLTDWVEHKMFTRHHPRGGSVVQGCWCLAGAGV
ncbi:hypothetical protein OG594_09075 [Streptomyces sp. NBC_01214]|uniref:hypothetical protein n=1 Tax=Streptomyces sp. NBC_01214 TaxID=2903777 RepID=UPI0022582399|nr:hypothetical protein [Streptomyces sp. NBC_01214]MCX4801802.1 hypothetical protein [Streptomyces sp. NBC_01214]